MLHAICLWFGKNVFCRGEKFHPVKVAAAKFWQRLLAVVFVTTLSTVNNVSPCGMFAQTCVSGESSINWP